MQKNSSNWPQTKKENSNKTNFQKKYGGKQFNYINEIKAKNKKLSRSCIQKQIVF